MAATGLHSGEEKVLKISTSESAVDAAISSASGLERTLKLDTGDYIEGERSEGVQTSGPMGGDAGRTSAAEGKVNEEASLDMA